MTTTNQTTVIAEPGKQEVFIIREFDAPREIVFKAFSNVEYLEQFFAPDNRTTKYAYGHFHNNGSYQYSTLDEHGKTLCTFKGVIHEVASPERIIQTAEMEGLPVKGHVVLEKMTFESLPNDRTKLIIHDVCLSVADRNMMVSAEMERGLREIFSRLDVLLKNA